MHRHLAGRDFHRITHSMLTQGRGWFVLKGLPSEGRSHSSCFWGETRDSFLGLRNRVLWQRGSWRVGRGKKGKKNQGEGLLSEKASEKWPKELWRETFSHSLGSKRSCDWWIPSANRLPLDPAETATSCQFFQRHKCGPKPGAQGQQDLDHCRMTGRREHPSDDLHNLWDLWAQEVSWEWILHKIFKVEALLKI